MKLFRPIGVGKQDGTGKKLDTVKKIGFVIDEIFKLHTQNVTHDVLKEYLEDHQEIYPSNTFILCCMEGILMKKLFNPIGKTLVPLLTLQDRMNTDFTSLHFPNGYLVLPEFCHDGYPLGREDNQVDITIHQRDLNLDWSNPASLVSVCTDYQFYHENRPRNPETGMIMGAPSDDDRVKVDVLSLLHPKQEHM